MSILFYQVNQLTLTKGYSYRRIQVELALRQEALLQVEV